MTVSESLLAEFDEEMQNTRKLLERVPEGKFEWKPHAKSSALGKLASHVATIPIYPCLLVQKEGRTAVVAASKAELLEYFDLNVAAGRDALASVGDDYLAQLIPVTPVLSKLRGAILRSRMMSHLIHHRGK